MAWYMTKLFTCCLVLVLATLCLHGQPAETTPAAKPDGGGVSAESAAAAKPESTATGGTGTLSAKLTGRGLGVDDSHKLGVGDKLSFQIVEDREPAPKPLIVTDSGEVDIPYLGRVMAAGKTCKELGEELKAELEKEYYYRATVVVGLDQVSRTQGRVYVWGQVRAQGAIEIPPGERFTVGKAILRAGGFGDFANKKKVKVVRTSAAGKKEEFELNMVEILEQGKTEQDITLQPDDYIIVPARLINL